MKINTKLAKLEHESSQHKQRVSDYYQFFSKKQGSFKGIKKTFVPRDGFEVDPNYTTNTGVVTTVDEKLDWFNDAFTEFLKDLFSIEATNSSGARTIPLVVDGVKFGDLTALELMRLRGILTDKSLDTMYRNIPVREDNVVWRPTTNGEYAGRKIFETEEIKGQTRTGENEEIILKDPNVDPQHLPANYQAKTTIKRRQVVTGDYTVQNYTGEWTHRQRAELLNRKSKLLEAVITALKDINDSESIDTGLDVEKFIGYLTTGQTPQETKKKD